MRLLCPVEVEDVSPRHSPPHVCLSICSVLATQEAAVIGVWRMSARTWTCGVGYTSVYGVIIDPQCRVSLEKDCERVLPASCLCGAAPEPIRPRLLLANVSPAAPKDTAALLLVLVSSISLHCLTMYHKVNPQISSRLLLYLEFQNR
jgi:hypothetical protein